MKKSIFKQLIKNKKLIHSTDKINFRQVAKNIVGNNVDELVLKGLQNVLQNGEVATVRAGQALQAYNVNYYLVNSRNRIHQLRAPESIKYFTRELLAYFQGSLRVDDGLSHASKFWQKLADSDGCIHSNYGYYVFYQKVLGYGKKPISQYQWCLNRLKNNLDTRRAIININQPSHKTKSKDFPCAISIQLFTRKINGKRALCCEVKSRSTDIITGLPYDIGFFSFILELIYNNLLEELPGINLELGFTSMQPSFTQIYHHGIKKAEEIIKNSNSEEQSSKIKMPKITKAHLLLKDIYENTKKHEISKWIFSFSK